MQSTTNPDEEPITLRRQLICPGLVEEIIPPVEVHFVETGCCSLWVPDKKHVDVVTWNHVIKCACVQVALEAEGHFLQENLIITCTELSNMILEEQLRGTNN